MNKGLLTLPISLVLFSFTSDYLHASESSYQIPDMIVYGKRGPEKIVLNEFGKDVSGSVSWRLKQHLDRELGAPADLPFSYAKGSINPTADGKLALESLLEALGMLENTKKVIIRPIVFSDRDRGRESELTRRRLKTLQAKLSHVEGVEIAYRSAKYMPAGKSYSYDDTLSDYWLVQIEPTILDELPSKKQNLSAATEVERK